MADKRTKKNKKPIKPVKRVIDWECYNPYTKWGQNICSLRVTYIIDTGNLIQDVQVKHTEIVGEVTTEQKAAKIQKYAKVNQANLWYKWYQIDLMAEKENAKDETKRNVIINLCKLMVEIKLNNSFIKKTLDELIKIVFEKKEDKKIEVMNDIQKIILNKK